MAGLQEQLPHPAQHPRKRKETVHLQYCNSTWARQIVKYSQMLLPRAFAVLALNYHTVATLRRSTYIVIVIDSEILIIITYLCKPAVYM